MAIQVTTKLKLHWKIKRRLLSHVHLVLLHIEECLLDYVMHQLHFKDACLAYSRLTYSRSDITPIDDYFPDESLLSVSTMPWFSNIVNFLISGQLPAHWSTQDKRKFLNEEKNFYWDDPYLFK
jgi:hypothetical protein